MSLSAGISLGPYEIVGSLGAGGMGEVYRARDSRLGRDVALKVLPADVAQDPARLERFSREARAVAALNHPNIVTIHSTEEAAGVRFLTMELVEGQALDVLIPDAGMQVSRFLEIATPLADALSAAHQKGITHRDLKPANVMIGPDGRVKVLDFGLARMSESHAVDEATQAALTTEGTVVGTMPYMSPEQIIGRAIDHRSDLFSLGIMFYEMLTGMRPFRGDSSPLLMSSILRDTPLAVESVRAEVPGTLARLVDRCLEKQPDDRIQTARDVYNELRHAQKALDSGVTAPIAPRAIESGPAIAVLPFTDLSAAKDQDWFCDGIAEEILNALTQLPGLRVAARTSAFSFKGKDDDLRAIGEKLHVTSVLGGSVRRSGDRVRITAQLSDVSNGFQLWSERYDREMRDIFDVQDDIARAIAERLRVTLSAGSDGRLVGRSTASVEAYELLLKGRTLQTRRGRAILDALDCFERAVTIDPQLAEAHALKGDAYRLLALYGIAPAQEMMPKAREAVTRALALDPAQVEALATLANIAAVYDWDVAASVKLTDRALAVDPTHVRTLGEGAITLGILEHLPPDLEQRVLRNARRAREIDPLNAWVAAVEAFSLGFTGRFPEAVASARRGVELDADNFSARWALVSMLAAIAPDDALAEAEPALGMSGRSPRILVAIAGVHAERGDRAAAETVYQEICDRSRTTYVGWAEQATVAASASRLVEARDLLSRAIAARDPFLAFWKLPAWTAVRADEDARRLLRSTGIGQ